VKPRLPTLLRGMPLASAAVILVLTVTLVPAFRNAAYWETLAQDSFPVAVLALALAPIILTGGIDLSVRSVALFSGVVAGFLFHDLGWPAGCALAAGIGVGALVGLLNGGLVSVGVLPLVATLATRELFRGLAAAVSGKEPVRGFGLEAYWEARWLGVPVQVYGVLLLAGLTYVVVHHTWVGRALFALGDNERAARFAGLPVRRLKLGLYVWSGLVAGLAGAAVVLKNDVAHPDAEGGLELLAIACVVLGGVRITGGYGHVGGVLLGVVTVCVLVAGLLSIDSRWRDLATGAVLVAVAIGNEAAARWATRLDLKTD
jgi:ribose/xylose/arabinose/galactoside ABC-type transport system permease subunit